MSKRAITLQFRGGARDGLEVQWPLPATGADLLDYLPGQITLADVLPTKKEQLPDGKVQAGYIRRSVIYGLEPPEMWETRETQEVSDEYPQDDHANVGEWDPVKFEMTYVGRAISRVIYVHVATTSCDMPPVVNPDFERLWRDTPPAPEDPVDG